MTSNFTPRLLELRPDRLQEALIEDFLIIVFFATWCSPCTEFREVLAASSTTNDDVTFSLVDVERQRQLAAAFGVESVPKIVAMRSGAIVFAHEGALTGEALEDVLAQVRALDVNALRRAAAHG